MVKALKSPRAWQRMLSGRILDLLDPSPVDIEIIDMRMDYRFWHGGTVKLLVIFHIPLRSTRF